MACDCDCHDDEDSYDESSWDDDGLCQHEQDRETCQERCRRCGVVCSVHPSYGEGSPDPHYFADIYEQYDRPAGPPAPPPPPEPGWFLLCDQHHRAALGVDPKGSWTPPWRRSAAKMTCDWDKCDKKGKVEWYPTKRGTVAGRSC